MKIFNVKKRLLIIVFILGMISFSYPLNEGDIQGTIEFFIGNYNMDEPRFEAVYQKGAMIKGIAFSASIIRYTNIYFEVKYFKKDGELTYTKEKTTLQLVPVSLGIRLIKKLGPFFPYFGGGGDLYFYHEHNPIGTVLNYAKGYHFQGGVYFQLIKKIPILLGTKLKYTRVKAQENDITVQLGGFEYMGGIILIF